jgi:hypothetical protein
MASASNISLAWVKDFARSSYTVLALNCASHEHCSAPFNSVAKEAGGAVLGGAAAGSGG